MVGDQTTQKVLRIRRAVQEYFDKNPSVSELPAKDLMPWFIKKGIFDKDHRNGLPVRDVLRKLDDANMLNLIPHVRVERKEKNRNWFFQRVSGSSDYVQKVKEPSQKASPKVASKTGKNGKRKDSDESYVIDLCDQLLGQKASRQHKFDFLRGDPGNSGIGVKLPVDAYYPDLNLVIEYREKQHTEAVPIMDKRMTVSGISRGEQRRLYDERRRKVLPKHDIKLIEISYSDFEYGGQKRILRSPVDQKIVKKILQKHLRV